MRPTRIRDNNMKKLFYYFGICLILSSCAPSIYYQMYQTKPISDDIKVYENKLVYEDDNCSIMYDFWEEYGNIGFMIYNKSSENLYLHLDQCFYINNGYAYDYYQNRIYNNKVIELSELSQNTTHSVSHIETFLTDVSEIENKTICIPPKTVKEITEYAISKVLYLNCDLNYKVMLEVNNSVSFNQKDSPYVFSNRLIYTIGDVDELHYINNEFYVSKITNYSSDDIVKYVNVKDCANKETKSISIIKESGPDRFYIKYEFDSQTNDIKIVKDPQ